MKRFAHIIIVAVIVVIAVVRVAVTRNLFSGTADEPAHIAAGYDWWRGDYRTDPTHPPLQRILTAIPLVARDIPPNDGSNFWERGNGLLDHAGRYKANLAAARWANLLFLAAGIVAVALWAATSFGSGAGVLAALIYSLLPPILAHSGLSTTDMSVAAMFAVAMLALERWLAAPSLSRSIALGIAIGLGLLSKFSFLPFFVLAIIVAVLLIGRPRGERWWRRLLLACVIAIVIVWAGYRFAFSTIIASDPTGETVVSRLAPEPLRPAALWIARHVPMPAPSFVVGLGHVALHDRDGHWAYLLGECRQMGWWYYFPVAFFYKTPLAVLILFGFGMLYAIRSRDRSALRFVLYAAVILAFTMTSSINIGIRHLLPMYAPVSALTGYAAVRAWSEAAFFARTCVVGLLGWLAIAGAIVHPDYLAYFNEAAGATPQRILVDSNLDWGQDIYRLAEFTRKRNIDRIGVLLVFMTPLERHGIDAVGIRPFAPHEGWVAVSHTALALQKCTNDQYQWLQPYRPVARVGKSIDIYYIPAEN